MLIMANLLANGGQLACPADTEASPSQCLDEGTSSPHSPSFSTQPGLSERCRQLSGSHFAFSKRNVLVLFFFACYLTRQPDLNPCSSDIDGPHVWARCTITAIRNTVTNQQCGTHDRPLRNATGSFRFQPLLDSTAFTQTSTACDAKHSTLLMSLWTWAMKSHYGRLLWRLQGELKRYVQVLSLIYSSAYDAQFSLHQHEKLHTTCNTHV